MQKSHDLRSKAGKTAERRKKRGQGKPETFNFLGFTLVALGILSFVHFREVLPPQKTVLRYTIAAPENTTNLHSFAISRRKPMCPPMPLDIWSRPVHNELAL
jgi:hypothetical protein